MQNYNEWLNELQNTNIKNENDLIFIIDHIQDKKFEIDEMIKGLTDEDDIQLYTEIFDCLDNVVSELQETGNDFVKAKDIIMDMSSPIC